MALTRKELAMNCVFQPGNAFLSQELLASVRVYCAIVWSGKEWLAENEAKLMKLLQVRCSVGYNY